MMPLLLLWYAAFPSALFFLAIDCCTGPARPFCCCIDGKCNYIAKKSRHPIFPAYLPLILNHFLTNLIP